MTTIKTLVCFAGVAALCLTALAQSPTEIKLYEQLTSEAQATEALGTILKTSDEVSAVLLYVAAGQAFKEDRLEDSGYLFYAAQLRARFDGECFPPTGTGGDSPFALYGALSHQLGTAINPAIMARPDVFNKAIARVTAWHPKAPQNYDPGYEFAARKSEKDAHEAVKAKRDEYVSRMTDLGTLLNDKEYFAAFKVIQAYNMSFDENRLTEAQFEEAQTTMKRIEAATKLKGVFTP